MQATTELYPWRDKPIWSSVSYHPGSTSLQVASRTLALERRAHTALRLFITRDQQDLYASRTNPCEKPQELYPWNHPGSSRTLLKQGYPVYTHPHSCNRKVRQSKWTQETSEHKYTVMQATTELYPWRDKPIWSSVSYHPGSTSLQVASRTLALERRAHTALSLFITRDQQDLYASRTNPCEKPQEL